MSAGAGAGTRGAPSAAAQRVAGTVAVLLGGRSPEHEVSLASGQAVLDGLAQCAGDPRAPRRLLPVEVGRDGRWRVEGEWSAPAAALARLPADTLVFVGLHGGEGEDGTLQGFLELAGFPYTGSGVAASALAMDKQRARVVTAAHGLAVAPARLVGEGEWRGPRERQRVLDELSGLAGAWYVKPDRGGSSVLTFHVEEALGLAPAIERVLAAGDEALVEAAVPGLEVTCAVLGNRGEDLRALPPVEIHPKPGRFFDYDEKYAEGGALEVCPPRTLAPARVAAVQEAALAAYRAVGCDGYARVDFIVAEPGREGGPPPVLLELNTLPGFTARSLLPLSARVAGIEFPELCLELCELALRRHARARPR